MMKVLICDFEITINNLNQIEKFVLFIVKRNVIIKHENKRSRMASYFHSIRRWISIYIGRS